MARLQGPRMLRRSEEAHEGPSAAIVLDDLLERGTRVDLQRPGPRDNDNMDVEKVPQKISMFSMIVNTSSTAQGGGGSFKIGNL